MTYSIFGSNKFNHYFNHRIFTLLLRSDSRNTPGFSCCILNLIRRPPMPALPWCVVNGISALLGLGFDPLEQGFCFQNRIMHVQMELLTRLGALSSVSRCVGKATPKIIHFCSINNASLGSKYPINMQCDLKVVITIWGCSTAMGSLSQMWTLTWLEPIVTLSEFDSKIRWHRFGLHWSHEYYFENVNK